MNKEAARQHRIGEPSKASRSQVVNTIGTITGIDVSTIGFLDLEASWQLLNEFHSTRARYQDALFSIEPPDEFPFVYVTIPNQDHSRLQSTLRTLSAGVSQSEIMLLGKHTKRAGAVIVPAKPIVRSLDRLVEPLGDLGSVGIYDTAMRGGLQFSSQEWSRDRSLQDDEASYRLWHLFAWGELAGWFVEDR